MNRPPRGAASTRGEGFTLVEVAVVIVMIGVMAAVALVFITPRSLSASPRGYADEVAALCDSVRHRAVAARTFQRIEVQGDRVLHSQGREPGIAPPSDWDPVGMVAVPAQVVISAVSARAHNDSGAGDVPAAGVGLPSSLLFSPDGSATLEGAPTRPSGATIFVEDSGSESRARVVVYPATGSAYVYHEW